MLRVAVLISGTGSNLRALLEAAADPGFPARVVVVGADRQADGFAHAEAFGIPTFLVPFHEFETREEWGRELQAQLEVWSPDLVVLSGVVLVLALAYGMPLGLPLPKLHPDWQMLAGAGGWFVPAPDYLAFLDIFDPANPFLSDEVKAWIDQAQTRWAPGHRGRWYSLGINTWAGQGRWSVSHGGVMNSRGQDAAGKPTTGEIVSHAFRAANGTSVFMAVPWTGGAHKSLDDLRRAIGETHKFVKIAP